MLRTDYTKFQTGKRSESPFYRTYDSRNEIILNIVSEYSKLTQKHKRSHDNVTKYDLNRAQKWYEHEPGVTENRESKILWDFTIQCDSLIEARISHIVVVDKEGKKETKTVDIAIPGDPRINGKELEKIIEYRLPKDEIARISIVREMSIISVVVGLH